MKLKEQMAEKLKLPKDLVMGAAVLTVTGRSEAYVENYRGIIEYTEKKIRLQTKTCQMTLCGEKLHIDYYTEDEMKISMMEGDWYVFIPGWRVMLRRWIGGCPDGSAMATQRVSA